jgi:uncharacterized protein YcbX
VRVEEIWRYPVKSLQGERLDRGEVGEGGIEGDRGWAIFDPETGLGLTARRVPELLLASAGVDEGGSVRIVAPDGSPLGSDEELSEWLGRRVALRAAGSGVARRFENLVDAEDESRGWYAFEGSPGPFHDSAGFRLTLVSRATLGEWEARRFRSNLVVSGDGEVDLVGRRATIGGAEIMVRDEVARCVMVTRPQPGGIEADPGVLRVIARERGNRLAVGATIDRPGPISIGDEVLALDA